MVMVKVLDSASIADSFGSSSVMPEELCQCHRLPTGKLLVIKVNTEVEHFFAHGLLLLLVFLYTPFMALKVKLLYV
jgi:hypothetical protein